MNNEFNVGFWKKETGNLLSHGKGLTAEQVEQLKSLKEGDRFIIWQNNKKNETSPGFTLKVFKPKTISTSDDI